MKAVALLGGHLLEARHEALEPDLRLPLGQQMPADLALVGKLDLELLRELPEVRDGADRHDVVEVYSDLHRTAPGAARRAASA